MQNAKRRTLQKQTKKEKRKKHIIKIGISLEPIAQTE